MSCAGRPDEATSIDVIHAAIDAGMDLIDTADCYCLDDEDFHHNERLVAKALRGRPERVVVATKAGLRRPGGDWVEDGRPERLRACCEASLRALGVERIDLWQLHAPDRDVPWADQVGVFARMREEGKVAAVGLSNVSVAEIEAARALVPVASVQNRCNPWDLSAFEDGVVEACEAFGITFLAYSPVNGDDHSTVGSSTLLRREGAALGLDPYQVALLWLRAKAPAVMLPIPGASRVASARSSAAALGRSLPPEVGARLDRAFGFPPPVRRFAR